MTESHSSPINGTLAEHFKSLLNPACFWISITLWSLRILLLCSFIGVRVVQLHLPSAHPLENPIPSLNREPQRRGQATTPAELGIQIQNFTPSLSHTLLTFSQGMTGLAFLSTWVVRKFWIKKLSALLDQRLEPLEQFKASVHLISSNPLLEKAPPISGLLELDSLLVEVWTNQHDLRQSLQDSQVKLAQLKAQEFTHQAQKHLIHDLEKLGKALKNQLQLFEKSQKNPSMQSEVFELMKETVDQLGRQMAAGKYLVNLEPQSLPVQNLVPTLRLAIEDAWYSIHSSPAPTIECQLPDEEILLAHDRDLLRRALANLIQNALHAKRERLRVSLSGAHRPLCIRVEDDGPGVPASEVGLYLQGRKSSTKADRPALGLASAAYIVRSHGGRIIYETSSLGGACFQVLL